MNTLPRHPEHLPSFLSWPRTRYGVISAWLGLIALGLVTANWFTATDGSQAGLLQMEAILLILVSPAALITAFIAAFRDHERSLFVWIPIIVGSLFLTFVVIELTFPHD